MTNTIEKKLTHIEILNAMLTIEDIQSNPIFKEYVENEIAKLKKRQETKKPTKTQEANADLRVAILAQMESEKSYTITDMLKELPCCEGLSNQKVSAIVRLMLDENLVIKTITKRTSYFSKA